MTAPSKVAGICDPCHSEEVAAPICSLCVGAVGSDHTDQDFGRHQKGADVTTVCFAEFTRERSEGLRMKCQTL
jgi:hypothetical protein